MLVIGVNGVFFSIDPEVMYIGNALSYIKSGQIQYIDHPGTPSILAIGYLLWPFRIYAKLIDHIPFVLWAFKHYAVVFLYLRIWQGILFTLGVWIFLKSVKSVVGSASVVMMSLFLLLIYPPFLRLGSGVTPETLSFLFTSMWVWVLAKFLRKPEVSLIPVMGVISGLAVANKFTNLFLIAASMSLPLKLKNLNLRQRLTNSSIVLVASLFGFVIGTWSIRDKYRILFNWVSDLITSTGIHAGGEKAIFEWSSYRDSIIGLHHQIPWLFLGIILTLSISIAQKKLSTLVMIFTIGVLAFAKYPLTYYQLSNYTVLVFLLATSLARMNKVTPIAFCLLLLPLVNSMVNEYLATTTLAMNKAKVLEDYIIKHPAQKAALWEWGRAKDPALLLTTSSGWHGSMFADEVRDLKISMFELFPIPRDKVFDICWDQLYIQGVSVGSFMHKYPERIFEKERIPGSDDMFLLTSSHCKN